jgi:CheY-like chemotaxis protein
VLRELLEDEGYRVSTSRALLDLDKVKELAPDNIVQDLLFEGNQELGWKFQTLVRLDPDLRHVPLVLCTAAVQTVKEEEMAAKLEHLDVRVVLKPFDIEELLGVLTETLAARRTDPARPHAAVPLPQMIGEARVHQRRRDASSPGHMTRAVVRLLTDIPPYKGADLASASNGSSGCQSGEIGTSLSTSSGGLGRSREA